AKLSAYLTILLSSLGDHFHKVTGLPELRSVQWDIASADTTTPQGIASPGSWSAPQYLKFNFAGVIRLHAHFSDEPADGEECFLLPLVFKILIRRPSDDALNRKD